MNLDQNFNQFGEKAKCLSPGIQMKLHWYFISMHNDFQSNSLHNRTNERQQNDESIYASGW